MLGKASAEAAIRATQTAWSRNAIDDPANLADDKVWLFSGYNDGVVKQATMDALYQYYDWLTQASNIFYQNNVDAGHAQITLDHGAACDFTGKQFINDCDYDGAGLLLQHIYGKLKPKNRATLSGSVVKFDQNEFVAGDSWLAGMSHYGFAYIPSSCAAGEPCKLHVAFHGCEQYAAKVGSAFYQQAGYNEWADTNHLIVLYPQTVATTLTPFNPKGCWDWWGYTGDDYATKAGRQVSAVRAMINRLSAGYEPQEPPQDTFAAPQGLTAADSSDTSVALFWTPNNAAKGFNVYRAEGAEEEFVRINESLIEGASYADSGLQPQREYHYTVAAVDAEESDRAQPVKVTTAASAPACDPYFADNVTHTRRGRAYVGGLFNSYAHGSNDSMGPWHMMVERNLLKEGNVYRLGTCE